MAKFLELVANGEQGQAEAMLKDDASLVLFAGEIKDLSGRSFNNITALQYAVWALDYNMWTMLIKYLKLTEIKNQLSKIKEGFWVQ